MSFFPATGTRQKTCPELYIRDKVRVGRFRPGENTVIFTHTAVIFSAASYTVFAQLTHTSYSCSGTENESYKPAVPNALPYHATSPRGNTPLLEEKSIKYNAARSAPVEVVNEV